MWKGYLRILSAEWLKLSGSKLWLLAAVSPAAAVPIGLTSSTPEGGKPDWSTLLSGMSLLHALLFLPVLSGLYAAVLCRHEHADGGWKSLLALPVPRSCVYMAKFTAAAVLLAATQLLFAAAEALTGKGMGLAGPVPWSVVLGSAAAGWLSCLPLAALQLAVSQAWSSFAAPLALNAALTLPGILIVNSRSLAPYYPWVQPALAMLPHGGAAYSAHNQPLGSLLLVIPGSLGLFLGIGLLLFRRKAV